MYQGVIEVTGVHDQVGICACVVARMQRLQEHRTLNDADADAVAVAHDDGRRTQAPRSSGEPADSSDNGDNTGAEGRTKRGKLRAFSSKTKARTKKLLRIEDRESTDEGSDSKEHGVLSNLEHDPAFSHNKLYKQKRWSNGKTAYRPLGALESIAATVVHPKKAIKSKATRTTAGQLSKAERPFLSKKADLEFLEAHDNLYRAESSKSSSHLTSDSETEDVTVGYREKIKKMQENRESLRAAWITSRHIRRVRVVPKRHIEYRNRKLFIRKDSEGERFDWLSWLGYVKPQVHIAKWSSANF